VCRWTRLSELATEIDRLEAVLAEKKRLFFAEARSLAPSTTVTPPAAQPLNVVSSSPIKPSSRRPLSYLTPKEERLLEILTKGLDEQATLREWGLTKSFYRVRNQLMKKLDVNLPHELLPKAKALGIIRSSP
jgi:hypothetical protein